MGHPKYDLGHAQGRVCGWNEAITQVREALTALAVDAEVLEALPKEKVTRAKQYEARIAKKRAEIAELEAKLAEQPNQQV